MTIVMLSGIYSNCDSQHSSLDQNIPLCEGRTNFVRDLCYDYCKLYFEKWQSPNTIPMHVQYIVFIYYILHTQCLFASIYYEVCRASPDPGCLCGVGEVEMCIERRIKTLWILFHHRWKCTSFVDIFSSCEELVFLHETWWKEIEKIWFWGISRIGACDKPREFCPDT